MAGIQVTDDASIEVEQKRDYGADYYLKVTFYKPDDDEHVYSKELWLRDCDGRRDVTMDRIQDGVNELVEQIESGGVVIDDVVKVTVEERNTIRATPYEDVNWRD